MRLEGPVRPELLADKLRIPRLSLAILRRGRVIDLVERAVGHRVTMVSGPAGAGKTVACGSWASAAPAGRRVAWLTLDADDQDPARFWGYVQAALAGAGAIPGDAAQALRDAAAGGLPLRVAEAAQQLTEPATLVLDDVHELADGPVLAGLDLLIRHAPPTLRLILSGRCAPRLQLARLRVAGDLADVNAADLACTADEADAYFAMLGLDVDAFARDELLRRTEGWMAGLRLAAMGARSQMRENGRITDIAGDEPLVTDYLWDEVLGRQPPEIRLFMLRTSVTEQMSGDLADALTGEPGGGRTLERLSRENSFVEALGNDHAGYRYHPLLRDVLAAERAREIRTKSRSCCAARRAGTQRTTRPSTRCAAPPRRGTGTTPRTCWPKPGSPRWCAAGRRRWSRCWRCSRRSSARTTPPWLPRWPRPGCGPATRTAPAITWRPRSGQSVGAARRRAGASSPGWRRCG